MNGQTNKKNILIIDNNNMNIKLYTVILRRLHVQIDSTSNKIDVVEKVSTFKPDMIIVEIIYPPSSNISLLRRIRNVIDEKSTLIIAVSSCVMKKDKELLLSSGCNVFIPVPIDTKVFFNFFERSLKFNDNF